MDLEKNGLFIKKLREQHKLSQDDLAYRIHVDRSNVSRWENGKTQVPTDKLRILSELLNVTVDELLYGELNTKKNKKEHNKILFEYLNEKENKIKKLRIITIITFFIIVLLSIFGYLSYYFFQTYDTEKIYKVSLESNEYKVLNGLLVATRDNVYLKIGAINDKITDIQIIYAINDNQEILYTGSSDDTIVDYNGYNEIFNQMEINDYLNNLYLKIDGKNIKMNFTEEYKNKQILIKKDQIISDDKTIIKDKIIIPQKINDQFECSNEKCEYEDKKYIYNYDTNTKVFTLIDKKKQAYITYYIDENIFDYFDEELNFTINGSNCNYNELECKKYNELYNTYIYNIIKKYIN